jgi:hypothetical protein
VKRDRRFPIVLSASERWALHQIAKAEALSAASVVRRLIIREARKRGLWPRTEECRRQQVAGADAVDRNQRERS